MMDPTTQLFVQAKTGDKKARDTLIEDNLGLVRYIVKRFLNRGYEAEDLFQIGCVGLIKAIDQFDIKYQVRFSTYAVPVITGEIKQFLRDDGLIKVSRSMKENACRIRQTEEKFEKINSRAPTLNELEKLTGLSKEDIAMASEACAEVESIYKTIYQSDGKEMFLIDQLQNCKNMGQADAVDDGEKEALLNRILVRELMAKMDESDRRIIYMRYYEEKTQTEIAKELSMTQVQVCRMEKRIVKSMRKLLQCDSKM